MITGTPITTSAYLGNPGLDDETLDVAVFSLSLMGSNVIDYLYEAHRTLRACSRSLG